MTLDIVNTVKRAMRLTGSAYDEEVTRLIMAAQSDLKMVGIETAAERYDDPSVQMAIITFCRCNFGSPADYDRLKRAYDEQKAQLQVAAGYGGADGEG